MERHEFLSGWLLLTAQPWGKAYRSTTPSLPGHEPNPAEIQAELYWKALHQTNPFVWQAVCEVFAAGEHWPSIGELKTSIWHNTKQEPSDFIARNVTIEWAEAPEPLSQIFQYALNHHTTVKVATLTLLPSWLAEHPHHEQYANARLFLETAQKNFGVHSSQRGNIRILP